MSLVSTEAAPPRASERGWGLAAVVLGSAFLAVGPLLVRLAPVDPVAAAFWRMALAVPFLLLIVVLLARRASAPAVKAAIPWSVVVAGGFFFAGDLAVWHIGIHLTTLANSALLSNTTTLLLALYALVVLRERPTPLVIVALLLALAGTVLLGTGSAKAAPNGGAASLLGDALCLLAAVFYTAYLVVVARARATASTFDLLARVSPACAAFLLPVALLSPGAFMPAALEGWSPLFGLALGSQVIGQGLIVFGFGRTSPLLGGLALLVQPVIAAAIGWVAYDERLGWVAGSGALLLIVALVLVRLAPARSAS
jgi:drug/metabolite transporter (DMT)-like permease